MTRWWPPTGLAAMLLLGWVVGDASTPLDDWFLRLGERMGSYREWFLVFTDWRLLAVVLLTSIVVALRRGNWRLAAAMAVSPPLAIAVVQICKRIFDRQKGGALAYPSGHVTFAVVVLGLVVVMAGVALWAVALAVALGALGMFGQAITYHYFTDTVGAALLASAVVPVVGAIYEHNLRNEPNSDDSPDLR
ncbi:PA-phosphatase [Mycolicibacterium sp. XJ870]